MKLHILSLLSLIVFQNSLNAVQFLPKDFDSAQCTYNQEADGCYTVDADCQGCEDESQECNSETNTTNNNETAHKIAQLIVSKKFFDIVGQTTVKSKVLVKEFLSSLFKELNFKKDQLEFLKQDFSQLCNLGSEYFALKADYEKEHIKVYSSTFQKVMSEAFASQIKSGDYVLDQDGIYPVQGKEFNWKMYDEQLSKIETSVRKHMERSGNHQALKNLEQSIGFIAIKWIPYVQECGDALMKRYKENESKIQELIASFLISHFAGFKSIVCQVLDEQIKAKA